MRLRRPCEHDRYDGHAYSMPHGDGRTVWAPFHCPGGEFLPEDAIVGNVVAIRDRGLVNGKPYPEPWLVTICTTAEPEKFTRYALVPVAADQVGEPG